MKYTDNQIEDVRCSVNIADVIKDCICPNCNSEMSVSEKVQIYKCFNCGNGGNVFTYIMQKYNVDFVKAVEFIKNGKWQNE